jgi:hypothetical protein
MNKIEIIAEQMSILEQKASLSASIEYLTKITSSCDVFDSITKTAMEDKIIDEETKKLFDRLLRCALIDAALTSANSFRLILLQSAVENEDNKEMAAHYCAWHNITQRLKEFMIIFDSNQSFETNIKKYEQQY